MQVASVRGIGRDLPSAIGRWYQAHGYAFLGISDQNTYTWVSEFASPQFTGVPVVEASYPFGDVLAVGDDRWLPAANLQQAIDWIAADNGLPVLAAPASTGKPVDPQVVAGLRGLFGLEVYDARLAAAAQGDVTALWDALLSAGNRVYGFAGDDVASLADPSLGHAWIEVQAAGFGVDALMSSLRRGAFVASTGASFTSITVDGRTITANAATGATLRFIGKGGRLLEAVSASSGSYKINGSEGYVRIEATDNHGRAWSQPLFLIWR